MRPACWLAWLLCPAILAAGPQSRATQQPTFRASTELVAVDVTVVGRDGAPVKDLGAGDFAVSVDGQPRRIVSLQFVDQSSSSSSREAASSVLPRVSSNEAGGGGRLVLLVIDEGSIQFGGMRAAAQSIGRLLAGFGPSDRVGLAALPGPRMVVTFSRDRQPILDAVKRVPGAETLTRSMSNFELGIAESFKIETGDQVLFQQVVERECVRARMERTAGAADRELENCKNMLRAEASLNVADARRQVSQFSGGLRNLLQALRSLNVPKLVIVFSQGLLSPEAASEMTSFAAESAAARAAIYAVRLDRSVFDVSEMRAPRTELYDDRDAARAGLEALVGRARGTVLEVVAGNAQPAFDRLAAEFSGYYLLGIESLGSDRDGRPHRIQVNTARPGLTVHARPEFTVAPPRPAAANESKLLTETMQSPAVATEIPLRLTTFSMADDDASKVRVMVSAEIDRQQQKGGAVQVGYAIYDDRGKVIVGFAQRMDLQRTSSGALAFIGVGAVAPGTYTLKLAAVHEGRVGSVEHRFIARLIAAAPFQLGDLVIRDPFQSQNAFAPSVDARVSGDRIMALLQIRVDRDVPKDASLVLDIVKDEAGAALASVPLALDPSRTSVRVAQALLDARLLPPGDYGARVTVSVAGKPAGTVFTRFALDRSARAESAGSSPRPAARPADTAPFQPGDVLAPGVLAPFLDELAARPGQAAGLAIERAKAGRLTEAAQQLKPGNANDPAPAFIRGLALFANGQIQAASDAFRDALRADPEFLLGAFYIGACYAAGGREQQAINAWQTSLAGLDRFPAVYRVLGDALIRAGQPERATMLLEEALARWPDEETLALRMVKAAFESGRYERVWERADRVTGGQPGDATILFLAMQAVFETVVDRADAPADTLLPRLKRYRDLYVAAGGPHAALVAEWVAFVERKVGV
jgi:VWFA-related protein